MPSVRRSYTFKEGLTMMAAKAVGVDPDLAAEAGENARAAINAIRNALNQKEAKARSAHIRDAQYEISLISPSKHGTLINALNAKFLALQGRGADTEIAHVAPGEVVVPRELLTPELVELIAMEAINRGIDPRHLTVGAQGSVNPETGAEEFGLFDRIKGWFGGAQRDQLDMTGIVPITTTRRSAMLPPEYGALDVDSIPVTSRHASAYGPNRILNPSGGVERNDPAGDGWFGAARPGRTHKGVDITVAERNQPILSPIEGKLLRRSNVYTAEDISKNPALASYRSAVIEGMGPYAGLTTKLFYVDGDGPKEGEGVVQGQVLGRSQNRHEIDKDGMLSHVHLETIWNKKHVDPAGFLPRWKTQGPKTW